MGNLFKLAIFLTSFLPLWITILFIEFVSICQKVDSGNIVIECMMIAFIILILVFSLLCVKRTLNKSHPSQFRPYIIPYLSQSSLNTYRFIFFLYNESH